MQNFQNCPFKTKSLVETIGANTLPSHACSPDCAIFLRATDPRTGKPMAQGTCALAVLAVSVANVAQMIQVRPMTPGKSQTEQ